MRTLSWGRRRRTTPVLAADQGSGRVLAALGPGERARVRGMVGAAGHPSDATARRLRELGLVPGVLVTVVRRAPLGDPAVYRFAGGELSLRRSEAGRVLVDPAAEARP